MKIFLLFLFGLVMVSSSVASSILASSFGYEADDATLAFQTAINSDNDTIIIDLQSSDWKVAPNAFFNLNNKTIIFEPGVVLRALPNNFNPIYSSLFRIVNANNVQIIGYGAEWIMNKVEYAELDDSEYRHALNIFNCNNVSVKGLTIRDSGGDGIYVGGENGGGAQGYSSDILIEDVRCINHYRQGMSIASVENMTVRHCLFSETKGTLPEAGIDIEPFETYQRVVNLLIENCSFIENGWSGVAVALFDMDNTSLPVSITVRDCYFRENCRPGNSYALSEIHASADATAPVQGSVLFQNCFIDGSDYGAFYSRKTADAYQVDFANCVFRDVSRLQIQYNEPIFLEVPDYENPSDALGGYTFNDVFISYDTDFDFFRVFGWSTLEGISDISGNFTVLEPFDNGIFYSNVADTSDVDFTFDSYTSLPTTGLSANILSNMAVECSGDLAEYNLSRSSEKIDYPLGVSISTSGTASLGDDIHLLAGGLVIPANSLITSRSIAARQDGIVESTENIELLFSINSIDPSEVDSSIELDVVDCNSSEVISSVSDGKILVADSAFLPIGFYCEGLDFSEFPLIPQKMYDGGFNLLYTESTVGELIDYPEFLNQCDSLGLKNIIGLPYSFLDFDDFEIYVNTLKDFPSIISWNLLDDANNLEVSDLETQRDNLLSLDTSRVTSASWYNTTDPFTEMLPSVEMAGMQAYPWEDASENDLVFVDALWRTAVVESQAVGTVPFATPQAFNWDGQTYPSAAHLDCQTYLGFITGMKGALFYTFKDYDADETIDQSQPDVFAAASKIANEILTTEWKDVILFGEHTYFNIDFYRYYATWEHNGFLYLIAVNANDELAYEYSIELPENVIGTALNFFEDREDALSIEGQSLVGNLDPYQVAIYKMELASNDSAVLNLNFEMASVCEGVLATVQIYETGSSELVSETESEISLSEPTAVSIPSQGEYDVYLKLDGYLQKAFTNVSIDQNLALAVGNLIGGDFDNSNGINVSDFTAFAPAFGSEDGDEIFDLLYDLNCDGGINVTDFTIFGSNFGLVGDEPPIFE